MGKVKRVLILAVTAGAGHVRAAAAVEAAFKEAHPEVEVKNVDALNYTNVAFRRSFIKGYERLSTSLPSIWGMVYQTMERASVDSGTKKLTALLDRANSGPLLGLVEEFAPDAIVCTHYFPAEVFGARRRKGRLAVPVYVTLTDYDIHTMWIQEGVDRYFVATEEMEYALRAKGIGAAGVSVTGIPIMPVFSKRFPGRREMREKLGLADAPTVLMSVGGFDGDGIEETVEALAREAGEGQVLAVSGRSERLREALERVAGRCPGRVVPFGFVQNMHELMAASDFAVTKSGGLTSSECLAMGLPMVIFNPIPGQEERNADYLLESGAALRANSRAHLIFKVGRLLSDGKRRAGMRAAARHAARPRAAFDIAARVMGAGA